MPLLGKIVVIKRNGGDGTEFPLTAACLFGRKLDCDIRIQLPQVSKEHCKIDLNENKELILTNLSSVNPTRINGQIINQYERLKHGDVITIIDRSFRFEYPPPKTPKKRLSTTGEDKKDQALLLEDKSTPIPVEKRKSEHSFDNCLKDGSNLPPSVEQAVEAEQEDGKIKEDGMSPFCELYQMVKQDLVAKSPWKSELPKTPLAKAQADKEAVYAADVKTNPKWGTTPSTSKRRSLKSNSEDGSETAVLQSAFNANLEEKPATGSLPLTDKCVTPVLQKKRTPTKTPQKFSAGEVVQQILLEPQPVEKPPKSPKGRRSAGSQNQSPAVQPQTPDSMGKSTEVKMSPRTSPRSNAGKRFQVQEVPHDMKSTASATKKKRDCSLSGTPESEEMAPKAKKKRVSFGGQLSPELFDKRLPPNSPLRRGATPRRSLGPSLKSQSLLRRASTIGLLALRLDEVVPEAQTSSPKKASPRRAAKTPSPAKRTPSTKAKSPSPKRQKSPSAPSKVSTPSSTPAIPKSPVSSRRVSTSAIESVGDMSTPETPRVQGRFSVSRISTPSPVQDQGEQLEEEVINVEDVPQKYETPKIPLRRKSMKSSARKSQRISKSALEVIRSRRSGASQANLKVASSWADVVRFGQTKLQNKVATKKKTTRSKMVKRTVVSKPKTPARRLKNEVSTGHAASPATIIVGKAHMRTNQSSGSAPKMVSNIALCKKDMKMDEDFTGVADIFKTPANTSRSKNIAMMNNEGPETTVDEFSVMKTPEESGEMIVSPLSVVSSIKCGQYNNEAVTRLLLDNQDDSLMEDEGVSQVIDSSDETSDLDSIPDQEMPSNDQTEMEEASPDTRVTTPKQKAAPSLCLTGVKRLMKTPKQKAEPIEDLRGKILKTPKECKAPQEESLEGVKELLETPKHRESLVEDLVGVKSLMKTPKEKTNPVLCRAALQRLMKTPKEKFEHQEDLTGVKELMKTPKVKGDTVENKYGLKRLLKTPKRKRSPVEEDLTGVQQLMKTPKHKGEPVEDQIGLKRLMRTPKEKVEPVEDLTGLKQLMQTPKQQIAEPFDEIIKAPQGMMPEEDVTSIEEPENKSTLTIEDVVTGTEEAEENATDFEEPDKNSSLTTENAVPESEVADENDTALEEPVNNSSMTTESAVVESEIQEPVATMEDGSEIMPAEDFSQDSEKENVHPAETTETEVLTSVDPQITEVVDSNHRDVELESDVPHKKHPDQIEVENISVDAFPSRIDEKTVEQSEETVHMSDKTSLTTEAIPQSISEEERELIKPLLVAKNQRVGRGRAAQKSKVSINEVAKAPAMLALPPSSPAKSRRGKTLLEIPEVTASPIRKSARSRIPKNRLVDEEEKNMEASQVLADSKIQVPIATKTRRGRKAAQDAAAIEPVLDDLPGSDAPAKKELVEVPVVKPGRQRKLDKTKRECVESVVPEEVVSQPSSTEIVSAPRARRGRQLKKEASINEPTPALESEITCSQPAIDAEKPETSVSKSRIGRGRKPQKSVKDELLHDVVEASQTVAEANVEHKDEPEMPVVKSGRGRKAKQMELQISEEVVDQHSQNTKLLKQQISDVVDQHAVDLTGADKPTEPVEKSVRGSRKTRVAISVESDNVVNLDKEAEVPVIKSTRKRGVVAKQAETDSEIVVKRARRTVADPAPAVAVVSSRGRKAVAKSEVEAPSEEPVKPVRNSRRTAKNPESKKEESSVTQSGSESTAFENAAVLALNKVERGARGRKTKVSINDIHNQVNESSTAEEMKPSKNVSWNKDLVISKDMENSEPSACIEETQLKKSKSLGKSPAEVTSTNANKSTDLPPRGRRGRAAKKEEELPIEDPQEEASIKTKPLRRGRALASVPLTSEPSESKASTPLKRKRNVLDVPDESTNKEPLPKRRGRVTKSVEVVAEMPDVEPENPQANPKRAVRGRKKATQEPDLAPAPESGTTTRKGRSVKKVEEEAAPVRRTRRK